MTSCESFKPINTLHRATGLQNSPRSPPCGVLASTSPVNTLPPESTTFDPPVTAMFSVQVTVVAVVTPSSQCEFPREEAPVHSGINPEVPEPVTEPPAPEPWSV